MIQSVPSNRLVSKDSIKMATVYLLSQRNQSRVVSTTLANALRFVTRKWIDAFLKTLLSSWYVLGSNYYAHLYKLLMLTLLIQIQKLYITSEKNIRTNMYKWNYELLLDMISIHIDMFSWKVTLVPIPRFLELMPWLFFVFVFKRFIFTLEATIGIPGFLTVGHVGDATWMMLFSWWRVLLYPPGN